MPLRAVDPILNSMVDLLEQGTIAFLYRPREQTDVARGIEDVQGFYVLLVPNGGHVARPVRVGRKRMPDSQSRERFRAYVERVGGSPGDVVRDLAASEYWTKTRGLRHQPGPRLAGEGAYALARHGSHPTSRTPFTKSKRRGSATSSGSCARRATSLSRVVREASGRPASAPLLQGIWH